MCMFVARNAFIPQLEHRDVERRSAIIGYTCMCNPIPNYFLLAPSFLVCLSDICTTTRSILTG